MRIAMIGTGYVGLVTGTCFAESGNDVVCVDIDRAKIEGLRQGKLPIFEPGLKELVLRNIENGQLTFTTDLAEAVANHQIIYLAVGTPPAEDGSADLTALRKVVDQIAPHLTARFRSAPISTSLSGFTSCSVGGSTSPATPSSSKRVPRSTIS
jgi:UDPglucose 6-dehydrogenase